MKREELFACLEKASEVFVKQSPGAVVEAEEDFEIRMQEEELARLVAEQMGLNLEG